MQGLARVMRGISAAMLKPSSEMVDQVMSGWGECRGLGYQMSITAAYVLLCEGLLLRRQFDTASEVMSRPSRNVVSIANGVLRQNYTG